MASSWIFFNNFSERVGWIPMDIEVPESVKSEYVWIDGLSVTEMEIMHGAYRKNNPNGKLCVSFLHLTCRLLQKHKALINLCTKHLFKCSTLRQGTNFLGWIPHSCHKTPNKPESKIMHMP